MESVKLEKIIKASKSSWRRDFSMNWQIYLLILPVITYFLIFNYAPIGGLIMAFEDYKPLKGLLGSKWVGFDNFTQFFTNPSFWQIMRNTFVISLLGLSVGYPLTIVFALLLNEVKTSFLKKTVQTISYMPYFISSVVICGLIIDFVSTNGVITNLLVLFGFKRENLLLNPNYFWTINLISDLWQEIGYGSIIFLAALSDINPELYEAATIDGANRFKRVIHVTLPGIMPVIVTMLILRCGLLLSVGFDKILLLYNPSIYSTADVITTHVQRMGIEKMQYGYSAAVGLFNSIVGTILLLGSNAIAKKYTDNSVL